MADGTYDFNEEYRKQINRDIREAAKKFQAGALSVIAVCRKLRQYQTVVEKYAPELGAALMTFVAVDSETDALPIGQIREMWHPSTVHAEDEKVRQAELTYHAAVNDACEAVLQILA